jgi:Serine aminopeptidase, S33
VRLFDPRRLAALVALLLCAVGLWHLEGARSGLVIEPLTVGTTPATVYRRTGAAGALIVKAPAIVIAHGFAGSRQLMEAYALTLAQAGYIVVSFDFEGHGRNPVPMSGDVTRVDGTTQRLKREVGRVIDAALALPEVDGRVALLGHSMASDIIVRQALDDRRVGAVVAVSMFSGAVTVSGPRNLLMISGAWETFLRDNAVQNLRLIDPKAQEGDLVGDPATTGGRRAIVAPGVEHVTVLYSTLAQREARDWLDRVFGRTSAAPIIATGIWIVVLLAGIVLLGWPLSGLLPRLQPTPALMPLPVFLLGVLVPAGITAPVLSLFNTRFLPVLVADYLAAHLFMFGMFSLGLFRWRGVRFGPIGWGPAVALAAYGIIVFGFALDRYVAAFMPSAARLPIIAAIAFGAVPCMVADHLAVNGGHAPSWRVFLARGAFLASFGVAVALDFERLFFLAIIIPVILLFFVIFGLMGGWVGRRTNAPVAVGIGLGLILAWSLGVSFPMFSPG